MINNVADLKNRTLVESNTLKQFILASGSGLRKPDRDDILIHDYQIANSVTLNSLLSNYIVNLQYAWGLLDSPVYGTRDSYFDMRSKLEESDVRELDDNTKLILEVDDGVGSFKSRKLEYDVCDIPYEPGTISFLNLDAVWYGIVRKTDKVTTKEYDQIDIAEGMNDFFTNPNPWGKNVNPFNAPLTLDASANIFSGTTSPQTFNEFLQFAKQRVNTAIENQLYRNRIEPDTSSAIMFGKVIPACKYIVCLSMGLYGLSPIYTTETLDDGTKKTIFQGMTLYDIGKLIPNLDGVYEFIFCGFHVIDNRLTLFVVFKRENEDEYRYFYFNNESYDKLYGFSTVNTLVVDQLVVHPKEVFAKVDSIKSLDTVNVLMTNYGFWDIEPNNTRDITYSYTRTSKTHTPSTSNPEGVLREYNGHINKVIVPTIFPTSKFNDSSLEEADKRYDAEHDKVVEYDKIWKQINDTYYKCFYVGDVLTPDDKEHPEHQESPGNYDYPSYLAQIYSLANKAHPFMGGTKYFAIYDQDEGGTDPIQILVHMTQFQFETLLFSMPGLVSAFIKWLYDQVARPERCEWYLQQNHYSATDTSRNYFCKTLNDLVTNKLFDNLLFKIGATSHSETLIANTGKFSSIENFVKSKNPSAASLYDYCDALNLLVTDKNIWNRDAAGDIGWNWLIQTPDSGKTSKDTLLQRILDEYAGYGTGAGRVPGLYETPDQRDAFIEHLCDVLVDTYPLLGYFREYIREHLMNDYGTFPSGGVVTITPESFRQTIQNIQAYIKDRVMTALILGEYTSTDSFGNILPEDNNRYPRIGPYIYQDKVFLSKPDVMDIMSASNVKTEVIAGVKSMPFFTDYNTYMELFVQVDDAPSGTTGKIDNLFVPSHNADFLKESKMFDGSRLRFNNPGDGVGVRKWDKVSGWLYPTENQTQSKLLKAFVRTQLYRPAYFKHDDYVTFTKDENMYYCTTDKFYVNHDGLEYPLIFVDGKGPESSAPEVDKDASHLDRQAGDNFDVEDISYFKLTNYLEYYLYYDRIKLIDRKFVFNDIEYYAVEVDGKVNALYFNEFQKDMEAACDQIEIVDNKFKLNGCEYAIETVDGKTVITVDAATTEFVPSDSDGKEFKVDVIDDKFKFDGIRYVLEKQGGEYKRLKYAGVDDNKLTMLEVSTDGYATFTKWNLEFQFLKDGANIDWNVIQAFKRFQTPVIDRLANEWCIYDSLYSDAGSGEPMWADRGVFRWDLLWNKDRTFDWYLANEIQRMKESYPMTVTPLSNLGDGTLFSGLLKNTKCRLSLVHETQGLDVVSKLVMTIDVNGEKRSKVIGDLFDKNMSLSLGRVVRGTIDANGLITESDSGSKAFILKDVESNSMNNVNSIWLDWSVWSGTYTIVGGDVLESPFEEDGTPKTKQIGVGEIEEDEETREMTVNWYSVADSIDLPETLKIAPVLAEDKGGGTDSEGNKLTYVRGFAVTDRLNGTGQRIMDLNTNYNGNEGKFIHLTAKGAKGSIGRYIVNLNTMRIFKLEFSETDALTFDFSTMYTFEQLRDNLLANIKQYMMNQIVQSLLDYSGNASSSVTISPRNLDLYLDLFTDSASFDNYMQAWENRCGDRDQNKYQEVFKNNLHDIDDSHIQDGRLYQYLYKEIQDTFQTKTEPKAPLSSIPLVDKPAFEVRRVSNVDQFTYECVFDLYLMQNKKLMEYLLETAESTYDEKFMICNAIVKNVVCQVKFVPVFDKGHGRMQYRVTYTVLQDGGSNTHEVEYDQIVYNLKEKTKHKSIQKDIIRFSLSGFSDRLMRSDAIKDIGVTPDGGFTSEIVSAILKEEDTAKQIFKPELIRELFIGINNSVPDTTKKLVETETLINSQEDNSIWELSNPLPSDTDVGGTITQVNLGETIIYGDVYQVKERDKLGGGKELYLGQKDGAGIYDIKEITSHKKGGTDHCLQKVAFGNEVSGLTKDFLTANFGIASVGSSHSADVYLTFKKPALSSVSHGTYRLIKDNVVKSETSRINLDDWSEPAKDVLWVKQKDESSDIVVGEGLDESASFEYSIPEGSEDSELTVAMTLTGLVQGSYVDGQGNTVEYENGWAGVKGSFKVKFSGVQGDEPTGELLEDGKSSCYTITGVPSSTDQAFYVYENQPVACMGVVKETVTTDVPDPDYSVDPTDPAYDPPYIPETRTVLKFRLQIKRLKYLWMHIPANGEKYVQQNLLVSKDSHGTLSVQNVIPMIDANSQSVGDLGYGFAVIPTNVKTASKYEDLEWTDYSYYIKLNRSSLAIDSGCIDVPTILTVLPPGQSFQFSGDIYGRQYQVEHNIYLPITHVPLASDAFAEGKYKIWMDVASTVKTIRTSITDDQWKNLIYKSTGAIDTVVPDAMREKIQQLVTRMTLKNDEYFRLLLTQFHSFLTLIYNELVQSLSVPAIRDLCRFDYGVTVSFPTHSGDWNDEEQGLFGFGYDTDPERQNPNYKQSVDSLNTYFFNQFFNDFSNYSEKRIPGFADRDYLHVLKHLVSRFGVDYYKIGTTPTDIAHNTAAVLDGVRTGIFGLRDRTLLELYKRLNRVDNDSDIIVEIFGGDYSDDEDLTYIVRYLNVIETTIYGHIVGAYVFDGYYNLFVKQVKKNPDNPDEIEYERVMWYKFLAHGDYAGQLLENKRLVNGEYQYTPSFQWTDFPINTDVENKWIFKFLNRDLSRVDTTSIKDSYSILCYNEENERLYGSDSPAADLWYVSNLTGYVYATKYEILDMAYEQNWDSLYVLFKDDNYLYRFDHAEGLKDSKGQILLQKENATMKIETFHSVLITPHPLEFQNIYLDYKSNFKEGSTEELDSNLPRKWTIRLYGKWNGYVDIEEWPECPGNLAIDFQRYNNIIFGDTLFDESQLRFQNISKNKDMVDILDINEIDGCYYGMFHDQQQGREDGYAVFKCRPAKDGGVIQKLPYEIINPHMFRTADSLYSLYVITKVQDKEEDFTKPQLREITVPDIDLYAHRKIDIYEILQNYSRQPNSNFTIDNRNENVEPLVIYDIIAGSFKLMNAKSHFFVLTNKGFFKVFYKTVLGQVSIDNMDDLKTALSETLKSYVIKKHMDQKHHGDQAYYFDVISAKVNQYAENFSPFQLVPTEFTETQDIGVIPESPVDNIDEVTDHRVDSIQVSTDIFAAGGMFAYTDTNPGIITAAVSNPATTYDDEQVFPKSQRNPSLEGSEFYDFIYDQKGNTLMDLYAIPFIYIINSNNTYDLYINVPTTRTKYLNRIAGTLKENGTTQVLVDDTRTRRNFGDETMANNLDESTTKLRIYIDKKYISIGNVELVEISGNSIPLQIYRDVPNNGFYDSIALESRWTGEVTEIDEPSKDINKVMLEFECYGTDSQSIHIKGKTLINHSLNDRRYKFG